MAGDRAVSGLGGPLADVDHAGDLAAGLGRPGPGTAAAGPAAPDRGRDLGAQAAPALHEQGLVDRLVAHLQPPGIADGRVSACPRSGPVTSPPAGPRRLRPAAGCPPPACGPDHPARPPPGRARGTPGTGAATPTHSAGSPATPSTPTGRSGPGSPAGSPPAAAPRRCLRDPLTSAACPASRSSSPAPRTRSSQGVATDSGQ